jgi:hypothetical protein
MPVDTRTAGADIPAVKHTGPMAMRTRRGAHSAR